MQGITSPSRPPGSKATIPIRNLWLLLLYASEFFRKLPMEERKRIALEEKPDDLPELLVEILVRAVEQRMKRNLSVGHRERHDVVGRVRGRIDHLKTERHHYLLQGKIACRFNELTVDTPLNRFILSALAQGIKLLDRTRNARLVALCRAFATGMERSGVSPIRSTHVTHITSIEHRKTEDQLMLAAALLIFEMALPTENEGDVLLLDLERSELTLCNLYERAIGGFYETVLPPQEWRVFRGKPLYWQKQEQTEGIGKIFPDMRTDIILENIRDPFRIIIDTKFTEILKKGWQREKNPRQ